MRIGYFADGPWSHLALEKILADKKIHVAFICARFDSPDPVLKEKAKAQGIPFFINENINTKDFLDLIMEFFCDLYVSMSFNQIFRKSIITQVPLGIINCHAGKLPFYRGRNILNWALINDEKEFGVTVHYVDEGIDTGDIILQESYPVTDADDYRTLLYRSHSYCADVLYRAIQDLTEGQAKKIKQCHIHPIGFYCSQRKVGDEIVNWNQTSREIFNFVRAICSPGPQASTYLNGEEIRINRVEWIPDAPSYKGIVGAILGVDKQGFIVKTSDSFIKIVEYHSKAKVKVGDRLS